MANNTIDLNVDIGEGFAHDIELLDYATSVNVACGWHAGDALTMRNITSEAIQRGISIGAHPSFPDRENFGRVPMDLSMEEVYAGVQYQVGALAAVVAGLSGRITHVKPHGALYNQAEQDPRLALAIVRAVRDVDSEMAIFGLAGGQLVRIARDEGLVAVDEGFADRAYTATGKLVPRSQSNAMLACKELSCAQAIRMVLDGRVRTENGSDIDINVQSICLHGDNPSAVAFARMVRTELTKADITVQSVDHSRSATAFSTVSGVIRRVADAA